MFRQAAASSRASNFYSVLKGTLYAIGASSIAVKTRSESSIIIPLPDRSRPAATSRRAQNYGVLSDCIIKPRDAIGSCYGSYLVYKLPDRSRPAAACRRAR